MLSVCICLDPDLLIVFYRVPTRTGKPGKLREVFPVGEKSGNFKMLPESQGKIRDFWSSQGN